MKEHKEETHGGKRIGSGRKPLEPHELSQFRRTAKIQVENSILGALGKIFNSHLAEAVGTMVMVEKITVNDITTWTKVWNEERILKLLQEKEIGIDYILIKQGGDWRAADALMDRLLGKTTPVKTEEEEENDPKNIFNQFNTFITENPDRTISQRTLARIATKKSKDIIEHAN
jgi:hypothetical protein